MRREREQGRAQVLRGAEVLQERQILEAEINQPKLISTSTHIVRITERQLAGTSAMAQSRTSHHQTSVGDYC